MRGSNLSESAIVVFANLHWLARGQYRYYLWKRKSLNLSSFYARRRSESNLSKLNGRELSWKSSAQLVANEVCGRSCQGWNDRCPTIWEVTSQDICFFLITDSSIKLFGVHALHKCP
ncbi:hypothetical protein KPH14_004491 [Odynerus spinipes]|uniref:Uncharacterized protein n=1 Tax=Odynerus spinipes TaxID=1348599 RepID=A0AAD9VPE7_9HYME|nr:hypothetical protein KPH14_004491 [Odynerus spinipes]